MQTNGCNDNKFNLQRSVLLAMPWLLCNGLGIFPFWEIVISAYFNCKYDTKSVNSSVKNVSNKKIKKLF